MLDHAHTALAAKCHDHAILANNAPSNGLGAADIAADCHCVFGSSNQRGPHALEAVILPR
jgi:hypothetical protein